MDVTEVGQYLATLAKVRPGQEAKLPALMAASHVDLTGKPAAAWGYRTIAPTLGRLIALQAVGPVVQAGGVVGWSQGRRVKHQSLAPVGPR